MGLWTHRVRPGDTIAQLALEYGSTVGAISEASRLPNPDKILPGQFLLIPIPDFNYPFEEKVQWARLLYRANSAPLSELTAITQYSYQQVVWDNLEGKRVLLRISLDEVDHLNTIAQILKNLGFEPRYWVMDGQQAYWDTGLINYSTNPVEILEADIHSEYHAVTAYRELINSVPNPFIQQRITHILHEEERHITEFERLLKKISSK